MQCEGKTLSVRNTKGESTDVHEGGGSSGRSDEALVTSGERSGCSKTVVANRAIGRSDRFQRRLSSRDGREMAGTSRVNREVYARFCGRLEVKFLRPTRRLGTPFRRSGRWNSRVTGLTAVQRPTNRRHHGCRALANSARACSSSA